MFPALYVTNMTGAWMFLAKKATLLIFQLIKNDHYSDTPGYSDITRINAHTMANNISVNFTWHRLLNTDWYQIAPLYYLYTTYYY